METNERLKLSELRIVVKVVGINKKSGKVALAS